MKEQVDARGLSCPQPVFKTQERIMKLKKGVIEILVDDGTAKVNVERTAQRYKWDVETYDLENGEFKLILTKK